MFINCCAPLIGPLRLLTDTVHDIIIIIIIITQVLLATQLSWIDITIGYN